MKKLGFILFLTNTIASAQDTPINLIECTRERPTFKQFCKLKNHSFDAALSMKATIVLKDDIKLDISDIVAKASFTQKMADGTSKSIDLPGLSPQLSYIVDWNQGLKGACAVNALWQHRIQASLGADDSRVTVVRVLNGTSNYSHDLIQYSDTSFHPWKITKTDTDLELSSQLRFDDLDVAQALSVERIPLECNMLVSEVKISYDPLKINQTLEILQQLAFAKSDLLTRAYVLNSNFIDQKKGAVCSIGHLASALKKAESLGISDSWNDLSLSSRTAITKTLKEAATLAAFPGVANTDKDLWEYFKANAQSVFFDNCDKAENYQVRVENFMFGTQIINQKGHLNAQIYIREKDNLKEILKTTWALIEASEITLKQDSKIVWPKDSELLSHF